MRERLEDVIRSAVQGKELVVQAERITAPDAFGVSQYRSIVKIDTGERVSDAVLDFLVQEETARVSVDGLYRTTIPVSSTLIEQDSFDVAYTIEHSENLPLRLVSVGENVVALMKAKEKRAETKVQYTPLVVDPISDDLVSIHGYNQLGTVKDGIYSYKRRSAHVFTGEETDLVKYGDVFNRFTSEKLRGQDRVNHQNSMRAKLFLTTAPHEKRDDTGKLVPAEEKGRGRKHSLYVEIANQCVKYLVDNGFNGVTSSSEEERESIDDVAAVPPPMKPAEQPRAIPASSATQVQYTLVEDGLVTIVKDVSVLDCSILHAKANYSSEVMTGIALKRKTEQHGFADYMGRSSVGSKKRFTLVPRGSEELMYKGLTLDTFADLELIAKENIFAYCTEKGSKGICLSKASVVTIRGKEYYLASQVDKMIAQRKDSTDLWSERFLMDTLATLHSNNQNNNYPSK